MSKTIRIATRGSALALWQAQTVGAKLTSLGLSTVIKVIKTDGDENISQPIYELGISGVFTKALDIALLQNEADIAVHSLKDVPTRLAAGLCLAATLERDNHEDVALVKNLFLLNDSHSFARVATCSIRRGAQWLNKYPHHQIVPMRGNIETRLKKFYDTADLDVIILAKAGLERLNLLPSDAIILDWMLPAPAQGIIGVVCRKDDTEIHSACTSINDTNTLAAATAERSFMKALQAGCTAPVSALAQIKSNVMHFQGALHDPKGNEAYYINEVFYENRWPDAGDSAAAVLLQQAGAKSLIKKIQNL